MNRNIQKYLDDAEDSIHEHGLKGKPRTSK